MADRDGADARAALQRIADVRVVARRAARASLRRHMLGLGLATAALIGLTGAVNGWLADGWLKSVISASGVFAILYAAQRADRSGPVRALHVRRPMVVTFAVNAVVVFAVLFVGRDGSVGHATAAAAVAALCVWGAGAWWYGR
jgi:hypothetical protein